MAPDQRSLDDLRTEIDEIDSALQDLLIRRTGLAQQIGAAKGNTSVYIRPGREAQILRRLVARHQGAFPKAGLVRIWRDIISALTALQGPLAVAAFASRDGADLRLAAHDHFGAVTPVTAFESVMGVVRAVSDKTATVGVLPLPQSDDEDPWWRVLARNGDAMPRVIARLPFVPLAATGDGTEALVIALSPPEESGRDRSLLVVETAGELSRDGLGRLFGAVDISVTDVKQCLDLSGQPLHLVDAEGYLSAADSRLESLRKAHPEQISQLWAIGGYGVPFSAEELALETAEASV